MNWREFRNTFGVLVVVGCCGIAAFSSPTNYSFTFSKKKIEPALAPKSLPKSQMESGSNLKIKSAKKKISITSPVVVPASPPNASDLPAAKSIDTIVSAAVPDSNLVQIPLDTHPELISTVASGADNNKEVAEPKAEEPKVAEPASARLSIVQNSVETDHPSTSFIDRFGVGRFLNANSAEKSQAWAIQVGHSFAKYIDSQVYFLGSEMPLIALSLELKTPQVSIFGLKGVWASATLGGSVIRVLETSEVNFIYGGGIYLPIGPNWLLSSHLNLQQDRRYGFAGATVQYRFLK